MRVLILYDEPGADTASDGLDVLEQVRYVEEGLRELGHTTARLGLGTDVGSAVKSIAAAPCDLIFNLVESFAGRGALIHLVPTVLDALQRRYTGASANAIAASSNKLVAKRLMASAGLPTPAWFDVHGDGARGDFCAGKYIVKSVWEHASIGLDEDSVIEATDVSTLTRAIRQRLPQLGGEGFAEAFVDGREFNLSVIADEPRRPRVLPPAEIVFEGYAADKPKVVGYRAKWDPASYEYNHTPRNFEFVASDKALLEELEHLAVRTWNLFELSGWARVDFRVSAAGEPTILEVNTNPCLSPDAGFAAALERSGIDRVSALRRILGDCASSRNAR